MVANLAVRQLLFVLDAIPEEPDAGTDLLAYADCAALFDAELSRDLFHFVTKKATIARKLADDRHRFPELHLAEAFRLHEIQVISRCRTKWIFGILFVVEGRPLGKRHDPPPPKPDA